ncbi:unnamed protein product [Calypogeia fissa]
MAGFLFNELVAVWNKLQEVLWPAVSSSSPIPVPKLKQLSETVYEVCTPLSGESPELEVIFFHGLQMKHDKDAYVTTWMSQDNSELWLLWLKRNFPRARILTISYASTIKRTNEAGRLDMYRAGENLVSDLTGDLVRVGKAGCPVVLVGHCLGGLVLKELCLSAVGMLARQGDKVRGIHHIYDLFSNLRGMFFYGTPHTGSLLGEQLEDCFKGPLLSSLTAEMEILKASAARRNEEFLQLQTSRGWVTYGMGELLETYVECVGKHIHVVPEASARLYMDNCYSVAADHYNICKPERESSSAFRKLRDFLMQICNQEGLLRANLKSSPEYYVDLEGRGEEVKKVLAQEGAHTVFITGPSGIGKSALVEQVFYNFSDTFSTKCLIHLDGIEWQSNPPEYVLRAQVLKKLEDELKRRAKGWNMHDSFNVHHYLKGNKVLVILDNIESQCQLDALNRAAWLDGSESRLVVTTSNSRLSSGPRSNTLEVQLFSAAESKILFHHYAVEDGDGPEAVQDLIEQVILQCENFPLSLKVLGRFLRTQRVHVPRLWTDLIKKLETAEDVDGGRGYNYRIFSRLRPCFQVLARTEQEVFLDAALVFHGWPFEFVNEYIWSECRNGSAWENLKDLFLVSGSSGVIKMHKQLRYMARSIACPEQPPDKAKCQRIPAWAVANKWITNLQGVVEALSLDLQVQTNDRIQLTNMTMAQFVNLQYLILEGGETTIGSVQLPQSLVYLKWHCGMFDHCPLDFTYTENLVVLDLQDCRAMTVFPPSLVIANNLRWLELKGCQSLSELPKVIVKFCNLEHLGLSGTGLTKLPGKLGKLAKLRTLTLENTRLSRLPQSIGEFKLLESLDISFTKVRLLPMSIGDLRLLKHLDASNSELKSIPDSIDRLHSLKTLVLRSTPIKILPELLGNVQGLAGLDLNGAALEKLPDSIQKLKFLRRLVLCGTSVSSLPEGIGGLQRLTYLDVARTRLRRLPESVGDIAGLCYLYADLTPLQALPESICKLRNLKSLTLKHTRVSSLPRAFGKLSSLSDLHLQGSKLRSLPETFKDLAKLANFSAPASSFMENHQYVCENSQEHVDSLQEAASKFPTDEFDEEVNTSVSGGEDEFDEEANTSVSGGELAQATILSRVVRLASLRSVWRLTLQGSGFKKSLLPALFLGLQQIGSLSSLCLEGFNEVEIIPYDFGNLANLSQLVIGDCRNLRELPQSVGQLVSLEVLSVFNLPQLSRLPESIGTIPTLKHISVRTCGKLKSLPTSFGDKSLSEKNSSASCSSSNRMPSSSETGSQNQILQIVTDSWSILQCALECCVSRFGFIKFYVQCEQMERVCELALKEEGQDETLAIEIFWELCLKWHGDGDGLHHIFKPSTSCPTGLLSSTTILLDCDKNRDTLPLWTDKNCGSHGIVKVKDNAEDESDEDESDDDQEQEQEAEEEEDCGRGN